MSGKDTLISGSEDATIRLWSLETMKAIGVLTGHESTVRCERARAWKHSTLTLRVTKGPLPLCIFQALAHFW